MGRRPKDLSGQKFGMLTVKDMTQKRDGRGSVYWHCVCDCGNEVDVPAARLIQLMQNDNIRKNIIAALLNVPPSEVENTELMPTILRKESKDDKYGILDVRVKLHIIIFWMIKNVIAELYSVMQRQEKSIQILWRCIS